MKIPIESISGQNIRDINEGRLITLMNSIKRNGQLQPIRVRPNGGEGYSIVFGSHRLEACRRLGMVEIDATIDNDTDDRDAVVKAIAENIHRVDMDHVDVAESIASLGMKPSEIARAGLMTTRMAYEYLALAEQPPEIKQLVREAKLAFTQVSRAQGKAPRYGQLLVHKVLKKAAAEGMNRRETLALLDAAGESDEFTRQAMLDEPHDSPVYDQMVKARATAKRKLAKARKEKFSSGNNPYVKNHITSMKSMAATLTESLEAARAGMFPPESISFISRIHRDICGLFAQIEQEVKQ